MVNKCMIKCSVFNSHQGNANKICMIHFPGNFPLQSNLTRNTEDKSMAKSPEIKKKQRNQAEAMVTSV